MDKYINTTSGEKTYMRIAVCDDEKNLRRDLRRLVEIHMELKGIPCEIVEYESGERLLEEGEADKTDILFLDIEMPGKGGMETARLLRSYGKKMMIIFVTAYPDFVFQGYEVQAFHYILKPYQEKKIKEVLDRALDAIDTMQEQYFVIEQKSGVQRLPLSGIVCFYSDRRNICAVDKTEKQTVFYGKLDEIQQKMPGFFQRVHNRYLVNMNYVSKIEGNHCICRGVEIPVSRTYKQELAVAFAQRMLQ